MSRGTKCLLWPASDALPNGLFTVIACWWLLLNLARTVWPRSFPIALRSSQSVPSLCQYTGLFYPRNKTSTLYSMLSFMRLILTEQTNFSRSLSNQCQATLWLDTNSPFPLIHPWMHICWRWLCPTIQAVNEDVDYLPQYQPLTYSAFHWHQLNIKAVN